MKKALALVSLATLAAGSFGCALTDYPAMGVHNKSHGAVGCSSDDRIANTQQTLEAETRTLLYTSTLGQNGPSCSTGFDPGVTLNTVGHEDARDWNRFIADYVFFGEAQVFGTGAFAGTWILAGAKDLADGATRLNNYYSPNTGSFSCVGNSVDGRYGGPEGVIVADTLVRMPGLGLETVAVDGRTGSQFCGNIAAVSANRAANGYSTYWSFLARGGEGRLAATPIVRREGLAEFLNGGQMSVTVQGVTFTGKGSLQQDGSISVDLLGIAANGQAYQAEAPVHFTASAANGFRTVKVENVTDAEMVRLADFALAAGLTDRTWNLQGTAIPEFGVQAPAVEFLVSGTALRNFIDNAQPGIDRFGN